MADELDPDLRQSSGASSSSFTEVSVGGQQQEKIMIPPSISKPAKRKRMDVGGKMHEDEFMVLNVRLKQYGYESAIALLRDFKDGIFPENYFKPQGALHMGQNQSSSGAVSLLMASPILTFSTTLTMKRCLSFIEPSSSYLSVMHEAVVIISNITGGYFLETILRNCRN